MIQGIIIQGTTPEHEFVLPFDTSLIKELRISYGQKGREVIVKYDEDCAFNGKTIKMSLTQEDTFMLNPKLIVDVQLRVLTKSNQIHTNDDDIQLRVKGSLNSEVLS